MSTEEPNLRFSNSQLEALYQSLKSEEFKLKSGEEEQSQQLYNDENEDSNNSNMKYSPQSKEKSRKSFQSRHIENPQLKFYEESKIIAEEKKKRDEEVYDSLMKDSRIHQRKLKQEEDYKGIIYDSCGKIGKHSKRIT